MSKRPEVMRNKNQATTNDGLVPFRNVRTGKNLKMKEPIATTKNVARDKRLEKAKL